MYRPKWDGFRTLASVRDGSVRLISRNGASFTNLFGPVADALRGFPTPGVLDGEVICINEWGQPDFEALQARLRPRNRKLPGYLCYMVFDVLHVNGHSLLGRPLEERQAILWELQPALQCDEAKLTEAFPAAKSARLMKACAAMGLEGVIVKRKASVYRPGFRSPDWFKVPIRHHEEFVVGGYVPSPRGFSTLILGQYNRERLRLRRSFDSSSCGIMRGGKGDELALCAGASPFDFEEEGEEMKPTVPTTPTGTDSWLPGACVVVVSGQRGSIFAELVVRVVVSGTQFQIDPGTIRPIDVVTSTGWST